MRKKKNPDGSERSTYRRRFWVGLIVGFLIALIIGVLAFVWWTVAPILAARSRADAARSASDQMPRSGIIGEPVAPGTRAPGTVNVALVVVDTQRADYLTPYGDSLQTTPFLAEMAAQGITFTKVFSPSSWTPPAMYSIHTGLYPTEHGITSGGTAGHGDGRRVRGQPVLPEEAGTLAEELKKNGFNTFGINTNHHLAAKFGLAQGFDRFTGEQFSFLPFPNLMVDALAGEIRGASKYFLWLHYFDPHFPYRAFSPWFDQWNKSAYKNITDFSTEMTLKSVRKYQEIGPDDPINPQYMNAIYGMIKALPAYQHAITYALNYLDGSTPLEDFVEFMIAAYKTEIRYTDEAMRQALATIGVDDQTLVVITADHGEEFYDHKKVGHRHSLYQELIHVPLVIRLPGKRAAGTVIDTPVSLVDIMPTILDVLELPIPDGLSGVSLKPLIEGAETTSRTVYCEVENRVGESRCIVEYPWKLIYKYKPDTMELYNLEDDPREKTNLSVAESSRAKAMQKRLFDWVDETTPRWKAAPLKRLSRQELKQLREMGYIQ